MAFSSLSTDAVEQIHEYNNKNLEFTKVYCKKQLNPEKTEYRLRWFGESFLNS